MTTTNPQSVVVQAEISIHDAIKAVTEFAAKYPVERLSLSQVQELERAAQLMRERITNG